MSYSMVVNIYQTISYTYGSDLCLRPYVPNTYSSQTYVSDPMAGDLWLCPKHLFISDPYVSDTYGWGPMPQTPSLELCCFSDTINLSGDLWCQTLFM